MSETNELRHRINALERDLAEYQDALEQHLYETELGRVRRSHGRLNIVSVFGSLWAGVAFANWLNLDMWLVEVIVGIVTFFVFFGIIVALTDKPLKREIDQIRKPLSWLPKSSWRENND